MSVLLCEKAHMQKRVIVLPLWRTQPYKTESIVGLWKCPQSQARKVALLLDLLLR